MIKYNNKIKSKKVIGGMLFTFFAFNASLFTLSSCSDDHFDINPDVAGQKTLWQNIESNENLSQYADILKSVRYSTNEEKTTPETYADLFNGDQTFTVWAPVNGSFRYEYYKNLLASGVRDSIYKVEKELIRNNMARYTNIMNLQDSVKIELFNNKSAWLNYDKMTIKGQSITDANVPASNGVLHVTSGAVAYQPNLYEYLASRSDLSEINKFIKSFQTTEFDNAASTQGPTIDGVVTYVDSVTYTSNDYTTFYLRAHINREDSNYVMVVPTNDAWNAELTKTTKYFNFKQLYAQDINTQTATGADTTIKGKETRFTQAELDSLVNMYSKNAICQNLAFNANWQYERIPITTHKAVAAADSLHSTAGLKFKRIGTLNDFNTSNTVEADFNTLFGQNDPIEVSNGYAYIVDNFTYPSSTYAPQLNLSAFGYMESYDNNCTPGLNTHTYTFHQGAVIDGVEISKDTVIRKTYLEMGPKNSTSQPGAFFKIPDALSCKYDIYAVIGYNASANLQNKFRAYISYDDADRRINNQALDNPNQDAVDAKGASIYNSKTFVNRPIRVGEDGKIQVTDTVCLAKDFLLPISYYGLENAYPVVQLKSNFTTSERNLYSRDIWVESIIFKAKEW